jgi:hypothetical protein
LVPLISGGAAVAVADVARSCTVSTCEPVLVTVVECWSDLVVELLLLVWLLLKVLLLVVLVLLLVKLLLRLRLLLVLLLPGVLNRDVV